MRRVRAGGIVVLVSALVCALALVAHAAAPAKPKGRVIVVADYGSSSLKVGAFDASGKLIAQRKYGTALGKGLGADKLLPRANRQRGLTELAAAIEFAAGHGVPAHEISFIATAATRNAKGRLSAAARREGKLTGRAHVRDEIGALGIVRTKVLTGKQEALLGFRGALAAFPGAGPREEFLVLDYGGNSHQATLGTRTSVRVAGSVQVGSNPIYDQLFAGKLLGPKELAAAHDAVARLVPSFPIDPRRARRARTVLMGSTAKLLAIHTGKTTITRAEIEALLGRFAQIPEPARAAYFARTAGGAPLDAEERDEMGLSELEPGQNFAEKVPAQLLLALRTMTLAGKTAPGDAVELSRTDARHAVALDRLAEAR